MEKHMKRNLVIVGIAIVLIGVLAVVFGSKGTKKYENSPVGVVKKCMNAIYANDIDTVLECFEPTLREEITSEFGREFLINNLQYLNQEYFVVDDKYNWIDYITYEASGESDVWIMYDGDDPILGATTTEVEGKYYIFDYNMKQLLWQMLRG